MRTLTNWSKAFFSLVLCFALGLVGCQEQEIIPIEEPIAEEPIQEDGPLYNHIILGENSEVIGYYDKNFVRYDANGKLLPQTEAYELAPLRLSIHEKDKMRGSSKFFYSYNPSMNISNLKSYGFNDKMSSYVLAPGCQVSFFKHSNYSSHLLSASAPSSAPKAVTWVGSGPNDDITSFQISCSNNQVHCGFVYEHRNYGGSAYPIFKSSGDIILPNNWTGDRGVSSAKFNTAGACTKMTLLNQYAHLLKVFRNTDAVPYDTDFKPEGSSVNDKTVYIETE